MRTLCRVAAWGIALIIVGLHIVPATYRPVTAVSHNFEHLLIFFALGMAFGLGYHHRSRALAVALPVFCLAIEFVQILIPGRHARMSDFLINTVAVFVGLGIAIFVLRRFASPPFKQQDEG